ncbi:MAG: hypothetical protein ABW321_31485 [Polyangiales bacterium]
MASSLGSAERLQKASDGWKLEFQQLVYNSPSFLRPRRFAVQGEQAILQQLREFNGHEPLAREAEKMFRGTSPEGAYVVRDGRWSPEVMPDRLKEPEPVEAADTEVGPKARLLLEEMIKRMLSLESSVRELDGKLEKALATLADVASRAPVVVSAEQAAALAGTQAATPSAADATGPTVSATPQQPAAAAAPPPPAAAEAPAPAADPTKKSIQLPAMNALTDLVRGLAGPDANLGSSERVDWASVSASQPVFFAVVQNNAGDEAGSMIFDIEAALRLAGALLMESEEMIETLLEEKVMSDEMLDAASEVCNTLTSALNKVSGNPHLRAGKMQPFTEARAAQLKTVNKRDDYRYNHGGRMSLVAC